MFCPKCRSEYVAGVEKCADCGAALVESLPAKEKPADIEFEEVLATFNTGDIAIVESILDESGIPFFFQNENFAQVNPLIEPARLMVAKDRFEEARALLKDLKLSYRGINASLRRREER